MKSDTKASPVVVAVKGGERRVVRSHVEHAWQQVEQVFDQGQISDLRERYPDKLSLMGGTWLSVGTFTPEDEDGDPNVLARVYADSATKAQIIGSEACFLQKLSPGRGEDIFSALNMPAHAVVLVGP